MIWNLVRWPLGQLILLIDFLTSPASPVRTPEEQARIDAVTAGMALYQFRTCPFCVKTRRAMKRLGLNVELRDARRDPHWRQQLLSEGGKLQAPCLYIPAKSDEEGRWLYESADIIRFLEQHIVAQEAADNT